MVPIRLSSGWILGVVLLSRFHVTQTFAFAGLANVTTTVTGRPLLFCDYNGIQWTKGTILFADQCTKVTCRGGYLYGAGYGTSAGVFGLPEGCYLFSDGCNPLLWTIQNGTKVTCFKHELIPGMNV